MTGCLFWYEYVYHLHARKGRGIVCPPNWPTIKVPRVRLPVRWVASCPSLTRECPTSSQSWAGVSYTRNPYNLRQRCIYALVTPIRGWQQILWPRTIRSHSLSGSTCSQPLEVANTKLSLCSWSFFTFSILLASFSCISTTARPYSNHDDDNVGKRVLAFGALSESSPNPHSFVERVTKVTYASGQKRGQKLVQAMACSQDPNQYLAYSDLQANGWNEADENDTVPPADLIDALNGSSLSTSTAAYKIVRMKQIAEFPYFI